jgi:hypothetical protein
MLVYLDTAQLAELERAKQTGNRVAEEFFSVWGDTGCVLALSRTHAEEIAPLEDRSFGTRLGLLSAFPQIAFADANHDLVSELEIRAQTVGKFYPELRDPYSAIRDELFPFCTPESFWDFTLRLRPLVLEARRERAEQAAFENRELALRRKLGEVAGKRPKLPAITEVDPAILELVEEDHRRRMPSFRQDPFFRNANERLRANRGRKLSRRQALLCVLGLEDFPAAERAPDQDLSMLAWLRDLGERRVFRWCVLEGFPKEEARLALDEFDPYLAPGISVGRAVYRGWRKSNNKRKPSDHADGEHVLSAAYTDLAFVDSRTETFIAQCRKQTPDLLSPHLRTAFRRASDLNAVIATLKEMRTA